MAADKPDYVNGEVWTDVRQVFNALGFSPGWSWEASTFVNGWGTLSLSGVAATKADADNAVAWAEGHLPNLIERYWLER